MALPFAPPKGRDRQDARGEAAGARTLLRAGYRKLESKLPSNQGFDGVFVKYGKDGAVDDIVIVESKFASSGYASLSWTKNMGQQMSTVWIDANVTKMLQSGNAVLENTARIINRFEVKNVTRKINVLDGNGVNRWRRVSIPE